MPYSDVPLDRESHRASLHELWVANTYDPAKHPGAMDRFEVIYEGPAEAVHTWIMLDTSPNSVVGACSVFRGDRLIKGGIVRTGIMNLFMIDMTHLTGAAALALLRALTGSCHDLGFHFVLIKLN